jgi:hypothetical protein
MTMMMMMMMMMEEEEDVEGREEGSGEYNETLHKYIYLGLRDF